MPAPCAAAGRERPTRGGVARGNRQALSLARPEQAAGLRHPLKQAARPATEAAHERRRRTRQPLAQLARLRPAVRPALSAEAGRQARYRGGLREAASHAASPILARLKKAAALRYPLKQAVKPTTEAARRKAASHAAALSLARLGQAAGLRYPPKQAVRPAIEAAHEMRRRMRQPLSFGEAVASGEACAIR